MRAADFRVLAVEEGLALTMADTTYWAGNGLSLHALRTMVAEAAVATGGPVEILLSPRMHYALRFELADDATVACDELDAQLDVALTSLDTPSGRDALAALAILRKQVQVLRSVTERTMSTKSADFYGATIVERRGMPANRLVVAADGDLDPPRGMAWDGGVLMPTESRKAGSTGHQIWIDNPDGVRPEGMGGRYIASYLDVSVAP